MYKNKEEARAYAKAHYQANKGRYNPNRSSAREMARAVKEAAADFSAQVLALSEQRFVYPDELDVIACEAFKNLDRQSLLDETFAGGWLPEEAKQHGLFLRRPPFAYHSNSKLRKSFLSHLALIPQSKRGVLAELLILKLVTKDEQ